ncbi:lipoprotein insertase outer membrane protein LolB [Modicisalibacter sp. 'Wilcox']|uniref:lipoprotein insertase outer membrane protein LolB n=1 Tax=Modicisalibacter sp. 'Wilcox' TaxID=2679914 RepID=UPI0013D03499|nr:lipoprotein insertase outer membrane protein LolB [Modicisalibacter sp. 'Wilcox']
MRSLTVPTLLLALLTLAGCASQAPSPEQPRERGDWQAQKARLEAFDHWRLAGKVGLRTPDDATSANLDWVQRASRYRMLISGPFGSGRSVLEGGPDGVVLTTGKGRFTADTPERLMEQQLGWSLPVSALDDWVRGLPAPIVAHRLTRDDRGFPLQLHQAGWTIDYRDWTRAGGLWLPSRVVMTFPGLRATLVVKEWHPDPESA